MSVTNQIKAPRSFQQIYCWIIMYLQYVPDISHFV